MFFFSILSVNFPQSTVRGAQRRFPRVRVKAGINQKNWVESIKRKTLIVQQIGQ